MPNVYLTREDQLKSKIGKWVSGMLFAERKTFADLGKVLGVSRQDAWYKARNNSFSYLDMVLIFEYFETPDDEIADVMKP